MSDFCNSVQDRGQDWGNRADLEMAASPPLQGADLRGADLSLGAVAGSPVQMPVQMPVQTPVCVRLDLEDLSCFTVVDRHYEAWGVRFENAVALHPSNPAYPAHSGVMVLLGAPQGGWLEATFLRPVQYVSSMVMSSRRTVMRAFNRQNLLVAEAEAAANLGEGGAFLRLAAEGQGIHRVTLESLNGQLTVDDFCFCG